MDRPSLVQAEDRRMAESLPFKRAIPSGVIEEAYKSEAHSPCSRILLFSVQRVQWGL